MQFRLVLAFFLTLPALRAQELPLSPAAPAPSPYVEREEKEFKFYPGGRIGIALEVPGNLKIVGWSKGSVRLEAEKILYYLPEDKAQAFLKKSPVRVRYTDTTSTIRAAGTPEAPGILEVNLTLYVPKDKTDLTVRLDRGDFAIDTVNGWVEVNMAEGGIDAVALSGYFSAKTLRGDIRVDMHGRQWIGQGFTAATQEGAITLQLPVKYSAALQLDTQNGTIAVDYPPQEVEGELAPPEIIAKDKVQQLRASVGDGGAPIRLGTLSGDITVAKKE